MLNLHTERLGDIAIIDCEGRIVRSDSAFALRDAVTSQRGVRVIVLDLSSVSALEGGGLGMLVFLQRWAYDRDIQLKLFNPRHGVLERLERANAIPSFDIASADEIRVVLGTPTLQSAA